MRKIGSSGGHGPESDMQLREEVTCGGGDGVMGRGGLTVPEKGENMKERLCKVLVVFKVRKKRVDSEVLLGAGEESREDLGGEEVADVGTVYGGSQVRPRTSGAGESGDTWGLWLETGAWDSRSWMQSISIGLRGWGSEVSRVGARLKGS